MVRDGLVFKDENGQVIFNQYSFCELVKHLLVELMGISYEEASQTVERSPLAAPVSMSWKWRYSAMICLITGLCFLLWERLLVGKGIPAQPEDMDAYESLEKKIMEKYDLKEPFEWE